jgi:hypothetical protein
LLADNQNKIEEFNQCPCTLRMRKSKSLAFECALRKHAITGIMPAMLKERPFNPNRLLKGLSDVVIFFSCFQLTLHLLIGILFALFLKT